MNELELRQKLVDALDDIRSWSQVSYVHDRTTHQAIMDIVDEALKDLCPQCHHGHESEEPGYCEVMCRPDPGETEMWKCSCSDRFHSPKR